MSTCSLGIIDYGAGNLSSVCNSFTAVGVQATLVRKPEELDNLTHLVLPGVGTFGDCSQALEQQGLSSVIRQWIEQDKPFLGICVGYQVLFESGEESPGVPGLGVLAGKVRKFPNSELKVPHMGWNKVYPSHPHSPLWSGMGEEPYFYYVHSYYPEPNDRDIIAAKSTYGVEFTAAVQKGRLVATQFHPEKSQLLGLRLLQNFLTL